MKKIRFILQSTDQDDVETWKDFYQTETVEVSDKDYNLLITNTASAVIFMGVKPAIIFMEEGL